MNCIHCNVETINPKFCSKSCAAKFNNKHKPKRQLKNMCKICFKKIYAGRNHCRKCCALKQVESTKSISLGEYLLAQTNKNAKPANKYSGIRFLARCWNRDLPKICVCCGYSKHIEYAHKKAISEFSSDSKLSEINSKENILILCPNCHWEFDKGLLKL